MSMPCVNNPGYLGLLYYHVVGDLTVGKPVITEVPHTTTVGEALDILITSNEFELPVWKLQSCNDVQLEKLVVDQEKLNILSPNDISVLNSEKLEIVQISGLKEEHFVGLLSMLDIVTHLASEHSQKNPQLALNVPISDIVVPNPKLLKSVAPGTRLFDALDLIRQGTERFLVPVIDVRQDISKRFSVLYHGRWLIPIDRNLILSTPEHPIKYCFLTQEDVGRFFLGCLGALAPFPSASISSQEIINTNICVIHGNEPAIGTMHLRKQTLSTAGAIGVVEAKQNSSSGQVFLVGEISSIKLRRCGPRVALALANLSAADFVAYVEYCGEPSGASDFAGCLSDDRNLAALTYQMQHKDREASVNTKRQTMPLTCRPSSSVAAVMAQMLTYRFTHVWVTEEDDTLVGLVAHADILAAIMRLKPSSLRKSSSMFSK